MLVQSKNVDSLVEVAPSATTLYKYKSHIFELEEVNNNQYNIRLYAKPFNPPYYLYNVTDRYNSNIGKYYKQCGYISFTSNNLSDTLNILFN